MPLGDDCSAELSEGPLVGAHQAAFGLVRVIVQLVRRTPSAFKGFAGTQCLVNERLVAYDTAYCFHGFGEAMVRTASAKRGTRASWWCRVVGILIGLTLTAFE
jgi:membrane associated rhomboid family serine protease